jgi:hypothetical protein
MMFGPEHGMAMDLSHLSRYAWHTMRPARPLPSVTWLNKYENLGLLYDAK